MLVSYLINLLIGVLGSIIASLFLDYRYGKKEGVMLRKDINLSLELIVDSLYAANISHNVSAASFHLSRAASHIHSVWGLIELRDDVYKKFMLTVLCSVYNGVSICINKIANEGEITLERNLNEYISWKEFNDLPITCCSLSMLILLNSGFSLSESCLGTVVGRDATVTDVRESLMPGKLIEFNCFDYSDKNPKEIGYNMKSNCYTMEDYIGFVEKQLGLSDK